MQRGPAAAARVERDVGVQQVADEVVLDHEVALVDVGDEGKVVHVLERRALPVVDDAARPRSGSSARRSSPERPPRGDFLDRVVELVARDEVDRRRRAQARLRERRRRGRRRTRCGASGSPACSASATRTSEGNEGVLVWRTASSYSPARGRTSSSARPRAGASIRRLSGTSAAGCASHVGYQNERISRRA